MKLSEQQIASISLQVGNRARKILLDKYGQNFPDLEGRCKEAAQIMIKLLKSHGVSASEHYGWCLYDTAEYSSGEPCAPHCYVLVHVGRQRWYLDCTATQFNNYLDAQQPDVMLLRDRPYWLRRKKPSLREMEYHCGY